jgi:hypothetical protein
MAGEDERLADTPWWKEGGADDLDESIMYPPELLGTSWGSYLASLPPTAGRKVVLAGKDERTATRNGDKHGTSPLRGSPRRSTFRNKDSSEPVAGTRRSQPHPHSLQRLSTALQRALDSLVSCGIDASPLSRASATVNKFRTQQGGSIGVVVTSATEMTAEETVLEALACQAKIMEEHAMSLKHTAAVLTRNQEQFARDQLEMQQTIEAAFSQIVAQQKLLEERKDAFIKEDTLYHQKQKTYTVGLREGQHRLALMQTRKEHSRLEKALLQQQRDLRRLEEAYKTTKAELAAEQYNSKQKKAKSEISRPSHRRVFGLQDKFHKHNKELQKLVDQLEASRRGLAETGSRLRASEREAQVPVTSHSPAVGSSLHLPCISTANSTLRNQKKAASSTHISLPLINTHGPHKPRPRGQDKKRGNLSCSELMELAHFRSPKVAREVMNWLEKEGAISDK